MEKTFLGALCTILDEFIKSTYNPLQQLKNWLIKVLVTDTGSLIIMHQWDCYSRKKNCFQKIRQNTRSWRCSCLAAAALREHFWQESNFTRQVGARVEETFFHRRTWHPPQKSHFVHLCTSYLPNSTQTPVFEHVSSFLTDEISML